MRWVCVLLATGVVILSPRLAPGAAGGQSTSNVYLTDPGLQVRVTSVSMTSVRPLEIDGTRASPVPEPSAGAAVGLLASAFLIRRRRTRLG
jgi:hypothetical protein